MNFIEHLENGEIVQIRTSQTTPEPLRGGTVVEVRELPTPGQALYFGGAVVNVGPPPSRHHILDYEARDWALPAGTSALRIAQDAKWAEVKAERDRRETADIVTPLGTFQADAKGRRNIESSVAMLRAKVEMGEPATINFTRKDDSSVLLTYEQMREVGLLLGLQIDGAHQASRVLRAQIYAEDATEASVAAVSWPAN